MRCRPTADARTVAGRGPTFASSESAGSASGRWRRGVRSRASRKLRGEGRMSTDTIADMLTRIRNANASAHAPVSLPASTPQGEIAHVFNEEGHVGRYVAAAT